MEAVFFFASAPIKTAINRDTPLRFKNINQVGGGYNANGIFTCSKTGVYYFTVHVSVGCHTRRRSSGRGSYTGGNPYSVSTSMYHNNLVVCTGSCSAALKLRYRDRVYVKPSSSASSLECSVGGTFTGVRIHPWTNMVSSTFYVQPGCTSIWSFIYLFLLFFECFISIYNFPIWRI